MNSVYDEVALLDMEEACYAQLLRTSRSSPKGVVTREVTGQEDGSEG